MTKGIIGKGTREYEKLEAVAAMLTATSKYGRKYHVTDTYLDFGQDWKWTTIWYGTDWCGVQVLSPRQWENIMMAETVSDLAAAIEEIKNGEYFND